MTTCDCCGRTFYSYDGAHMCAYCIMDSIGAQRAGMVHDASSHSVPGSAIVAPAWRKRAASGDGSGARDYSGAIVATGGYDA